jgi:SagB-type dehydrogenase family enzyme
VTQPIAPAQVVLTYHARTKHRLERYAAGPETLDWDLQPDPFRTFAGCPRVALPLTSDTIPAPFSGLGEPRPPAALSLASVGALLELSMGLAAWKEYGPDRWALRCAPSSGNLHPTETYVLARGIDGLADGVYHYAPRGHELEQRGLVVAGAGRPGLWVGFSSVHWREAWKYGERGFRYCQLDLGHALGALRYAAAALGWGAQALDDLNGAAMAALMGLDREADFAGAEAEEADVLVAIGNSVGCAPNDAVVAWSGRANLLDGGKMYRWPIIDDVSVATRRVVSVMPERATDAALYPALVQLPGGRAADVMLNRRSAQRFDTKFQMDSATFYHLLDRLLVRLDAPWDVWTYRPRLHPVLFVHRVEGLAPGLYALPRHEAAQSRLRAQFKHDFTWQKPHGAPAHLPLFRLAAIDSRAAARMLNCHQAIGRDACFALAMVAEFGPIVGEDPWRYRQLHWEAGLIGHVLYLEAEAVGLRGTGIGCFFDDALHECLGLTGEAFQTLYHFALGQPVVDARIVSGDGYPGRRRDEAVVQVPGVEGWADG